MLSGACHVFFPSGQGTQDERLSEVSLPEDVPGSNVASPSAEPFMLPEEVDAARSCCRQRCIVEFHKDSRARDAKVRFRHQVETAPADARLGLYFNALRESANRLATEEAESSRSVFLFAGQKLCRHAWCFVTGANKKTLAKCREALAQGYQAAPEDKRRNPLKRLELSFPAECSCAPSFHLCPPGLPLACGCGARNVAVERGGWSAGFGGCLMCVPWLLPQGPEPVSDNADAFFFYLYVHLAEPLALANDQHVVGESLPLPPEGACQQEGWLPLSDAPQYAQSEQESEWLALDDPRGDMLALSSHLRGSGSGKVLEKRWLPHMSLQEMFGLYEHLNAEHEDRASFSTWRRVWKSGWYRLLPIRPATEHARCADCALYAQMRSKAESHGDHKAVQEAYAQHIKAVFADRRIMTRLENAAEQAAKDGSGVEIPHLMITIDAMDKSKWAVPRNLASSKQLSGLWRPALRLVGVLVSGLFEYFAILEPDQRGDSDTQQTILSRVLDLAAEACRKKGRELPSRIIFHSDNTAKEGRNAPMLTFAAAAVAAQRFREVSLCFYRVGHTHNRLDQRFGVLAAKLALAKSLQTPREYQQYLQEHYKPARGVGCIIECVHGSYNWRGLWEPLGVHFVGLFGAGGGTSDAGHVFRVVRADDVASLDLPVAEVEPWRGGGGPSGSDAVLLVKHWISSTMLSQKPMVVLPAAKAAELRWETLADLRASRNELLPRAMAEYRKTAADIAAPPWELKAAAEYLVDWVGRNERKEWGAPPQLHVMPGGPREGPEPCPPQPSAWRDFAPEAPRLVAIAKPPPKRRAKAAPAAAAPVAAAPAAAAAVAAVAPQPAVVPEDDSDDAPLVPAPAVAAAATAPRVEAGPPGPGGARPGLPHPGPQTVDELVQELARPAAERHPSLQAIVLGCSKCRQAAKGCSKCRRAAATKVLAGAQAGVQPEVAGPGAVFVGDRAQAVYRDDSL